MYTDGARNQAGVGEKAAAQQNSELVWSRSKRKDQNVVGRRRKGAVEMEIESINFKLM